MATEPDHLVSVLSVTARPGAHTDQRGLMEIAEAPAATRPMGDELMIHLGDDQLQEGVLEMSDTEDRQWSPTCMHMATSDDEEEHLASGTHTHVHTDDHWLPACTHMSTSKDECSHGMRGQEFLVELSYAESVPEYLLDSTKIHAWVDGSEIRGRAGFGVFSPHAGYENVSEPVVGPETNNRAEVLAFRARIRVVHNSQEL